MRTVTRPSTARCTLPMYIGFILSEPKFGSCCHLSEIMSISHTSTSSAQVIALIDSYSESLLLLKICLMEQKLI